MEKTVTQEQREAHWAKSKSLMFKSLSLWFFFSFVIHMFVNGLNQIRLPLVGFPFGYYMAAQGSLIVFVVLIFWFAMKQNEIDGEYGMSEEDE